MAQSCLWRPTKGRQVFQKLEPYIGYNKAWKVVGVASNSNFRKDYKESLSLDAEGFPTYDSLLNNDYIQKNVIGLQDVANIKSRDFKTVEDTLDNYGHLLSEALRYNRDNSTSNFIAVVDYANNGIKINILEKTEKSLERFKEQYAVYTINQRLSNQFSYIGITPEILTKEEVESGRVGSTQFNSAIGIANSAASVIKIANNMEGAQALTEEFSHVLIDSLYEHPLVKRVLSLISNEETLKELLGDKDYQDTYDFYNGDISMVAEEALGKLLRDKLVEGVKIRVNDNYEVASEVKVPSKIEGLLTRLKNYIKNLFKKTSYNNIVNIINEANTIMSTLSEELISDKIEINKKNINSRNRDAVFNSLSDRIDRNIKALKGAVDIEVKRSKLLKEEGKYGKKKIEQLNKYINDRNKSALGVMTYAYKGLEMLREIQNNLNSIDLLTFEDKVKTLRVTKTILHSFGSFIDTFNEIINDEEGREDNLFEETFKIKVNGGEVEIKAGELLSEINNLVKRITAQYATTSVPVFTKFLKDSLGEDLINLLLKHNGNKKEIEELIKNSGNDISFMDLWVDAMRDSSNPILQAYDKIVKNANDKARMKALSMFKEIQSLKKEIEAEGITNFEFMFEKDSKGHKSGNYVNPNYNLAEYYRQLKLFEKELNEKYGENPKGADKIEKNKEKRKWLEENSRFDNELNRIPKAEKFPPTKLSPAQQRVLDKFLEYKDKIDKLYPENRVNKYKAVQVRKDGIQRLFDGGLNPATIYSNWKEDLVSTYLDRSDDDQVFGESTGGLTNFDGTEYMRLPVLYTNRLHNPDELSNDVFGSLYAYAAAATKYEQMEKIVSPLELGRDIIEGKVTRQTRMNVDESRGQKKIVETINHLGQKIQRPVIMSSDPNIFRKLDVFLETQVYQRYLKDEGTFNLFGQKVKTSKVVSKLLQMGSVAQLGFNFLANLANATTGVAMSNIEAASGQYFTAKELASADAEYTKLMPSYISEAYARNKSSKLALFDELFNVRQDFQNAKFHTERKNLLRRIFGSGIQYLGQEAGDHWLYNRIAIAMVKHIKVKYQGKETTLWDVLAIRDHEGTNIKEMYVPEGVTDMYNNPIDINRIGKISRRIAAINQSLFGIYNEEDMNAANRVSLGRILMQYRKWIKPQFNRRFEAKRTDLDLGEEIEGYYRTTWRIGVELIRELKRGEFQYTLFKDNLNDMEKANIRRALTEMVQFIALHFLVMFVNGTDDNKDDDIPYSIKLAKYIGNRLVHETGNLAPSYTMFNELQKTINNPAAILGVIGDISKFISSVVHPSSWTDELQSGEFKGHSRLYRNFFNLPLPVLSYLRQWHRTYDGLDRSIQFYINPDIN